MSELSTAEQNILSKKLASFIVGDVLNLITENDLLKIDENGNWLYNGKVLTENQKKNLKLEAASFLKSELWKILKTELLWNAQNKMLAKAESDIDLLGAKMLKYLVEIIEKRLQKMV